MGTNPPPSEKPKVRWLRGDEVMLSPDGQLTRVMENYGALSKGPIREALAIWPGDQEPDPQALGDAANRALNNKAIEVAKLRIQSQRRALQKMIEARDSAEHMWSLGTNSEPPDQTRPRIRRASNRSQDAIRPTLQAIQSNPEAWLDKDRRRSKFGIDILLEKTFLVDPQTFERGRQAIEGAPVFDGALHDLFAYADVPIAITKNLGPLVGDKNADSYAYVGNSSSGLIFSHQVTKKLAAPANEKERHEALLNVARGLVFTALSVIGPNAEALGIKKRDHFMDAFQQPNPGTWDAILAEFQKNCQSIMLPAQYKIDPQDSGPYSLPDILSQMHFALTSGFCNPAQVRADMPECAAVYDQFILQVQRTANKHKAQPLYDVARLPTRTTTHIDAAPKAPDVSTNHNTAMPEFLRGHEFGVDNNGELNWVFDQNAEYFRADPFWISVDPNPESANPEEMRNRGLAELKRFKTPRYQNAVKARTQHIVRQEEAAVMIVKNYPSLLLSVTGRQVLDPDSHVALVKHLQQRHASIDKVLKRSDRMIHADISKKMSFSTREKLFQRRKTVLDEAVYQQDVEALRSNESFQLVSDLLRRSKIPVIVVKEAPNQKDIDLNMATGLTLTHHFVQQLTSSEALVAHKARNELLAFTAALPFYENTTTLHHLGLDSEADFLTISAQYRQAVTNNRSTGASNSVVPFLSMMLYFLSTIDGGTYPELVRDYPKFAEFGLKVMTAVNPEIGKQAEALLHSTTSQSDTTIPNKSKVVSLSEWRFTPKLFTNNPQEQELIDRVRPFIGEALRNEPPCEQFRCHLVLSDRNGQDNFPIRLTFRNANGLTKEFTLYTGTRDLDEAIALKKAIQSHILNHPNIVPLRLRYRDESPEKPVSQTDAIMPRYEPSSVELVDYGRHYAARFHFTGASGSNQQVVVPLGLRYEPHRPLMAAEADRRLAYLQRHVAETRDKGYWETLGEVVQDLKRAVIERRPAGDAGLLNGNNVGWRVADTMPLEHFGDCVDADGNAKPYSLGFPATGPQATVLKSAILRMEEGTSSPNPSWRLHLTVGVNGLGESEEKRDYRTSINLHTADATAAQMRGGEAIQSLEEDLKLRAETYPDMRWHNQGEKSAELFLQHSDGSYDHDPEPQTLFHLFEDMPNPKQSFQIVSDVKPSARDGYLAGSLGVQRGTKAENDLIDFSDLNGKPVRRNFEVPAADEAKVNALVQSINQTFKNYLNDAYGNRTINQNNERIRKTRQEYRTATIRNLFDKAVVSRLGEGTTTATHADATQIKGTHVARA